jgi:hypothetical protein
METKTKIIIAVVIIVIIIIVVVVIIIMSSSSGSVITPTQISLLGWSATQLEFYYGDYVQKNASSMKESLRSFSGYDNELGLVWVNDYGRRIMLARRQSDGLQYMLWLNLSGYNGGQDKEPDYTDGVSALGDWNFRSAVSMDNLPGPSNPNVALAFLADDYYTDGSAPHAAYYTNTAGTFVNETIVLPV